MLMVIFITGQVLAEAWLFSALILLVQPGEQRIRIARMVFGELRPFYPPAVVGSAAALLLVLASVAVVVPLTALALAELGLWKVLKDIGDDDRWKKRRQRLAARIARAGSRLTVVPAGAR